MPLVAVTRSTGSPRLGDRPERQGNTSFSTETLMINQGSLRADTFHPSCLIVLSEIVSQSVR